MCWLKRIYCFGTKLMLETGLFVYFKCLLHFCIDHLWFVLRKNPRENPKYLIISNLKMKYIVLFHLAQTSRDGKRSFFGLATSIFIYFFKNFKLDIDPLLISSCSCLTSSEIPKMAWIRWMVPKLFQRKHLKLISAQSPVM